MINRFKLTRYFREQTVYGGKETVKTNKHIRFLNGKTSFNLFRVHCRPVTKTKNKFTFYDNLNR